MSCLFPRAVKTLRIRENRLPTRRRILSLAAAAGTFASIAGVVPGRGQNPPQSRPRAVATFSILGDLARDTGGERVQLATLVGADGDVHIYAPTPGNAKTIAAANVVFVNGLGLEGWLDRLIAASGTRAPLVVASRGVTARNGSSRRDQGASDPHAWQSVANAKIYVANIRDGLIGIDPAGGPSYQANAAAYLGKLDDLDAEIKTAIDEIPASRRKVITGHAAFGYFGEAYGIKFIAAEGLSTDAEPSAGDIAKLIEQIRRENVPAVFVENITDPRLIERIAEETGVRIGGTLYSDALSPADGPAPTYIAMMRSNARELTRALVA
jgi:zinc/manganese transport system substrate-binding protein